MKRNLFIILMLISMIIVTGCGSKEKNNVVEATLNENGDIIINEDEITEEATFLSYEVDDVTIGFIVVRGTDGKVRVAFNTCQSCTPSPNAYFIQDGEYFECQNCGTKFHVDKIGLEKGGCNPAPVEEMKEEDGVIIILADYASTYKNNFNNWNGPKV